MRNTIELCRTTFEAVKAIGQWAAAITIMVRVLSSVGEYFQQQKK